MRSGRCAATSALFPNKIIRSTAFLTWLNNMYTVVCQIMLLRRCNATQLNTFYCLRLLTVALDCAYLHFSTVLLAWLSLKCSYVLHCCSTVSFKDCLVAYPYVPLGLSLSGNRSASSRHLRMSIAQGHLQDFFQLCPWQYSCKKVESRKWFYNRSDKKQFT